MLKIGDVFQLKDSHYGLHKNDTFQIVGDREEDDVFKLKRLYSGIGKIYIGDYGFVLPKIAPEEYYEIL